MSLALTSLLVLSLTSLAERSDAFTMNSSLVTILRCETHLLSTPGQRQPRRNLQKRRRKGRRNNQFDQQSADALQEDDFPWDTAESRSLISSSAREAGEDYWIDAEELKRQKEREEQIRARRRDERQIPDEKLWIEVLSPYKQNWIGLISVTIIVIAFIFKNFPEVIDPPIITNIPLDL